MKLYTKMIGESLEQHCKTQYNEFLRPVLKNAYFEKDNDAKSGSKGDFIFRDKTDNPVDPRKIQSNFTKIIKQLNLTPITFHALRHTFASINIENGTDVKTISDILGHSDIAITLKTYTHTTQKAKAKAIQRFNDMFKNQEEKINFTSKYKGSICCINKHNNKCDFIGTIKEVAEYIAENTSYVCDVINGIKIDDTYDIVPKIEGITHKNGIYMGVI